MAIQLPIRALTPIPTTTATTTTAPTHGLTPRSLLTGQLFKRALFAAILLLIIVVSLVRSGAAQLPQHPTAHIHTDSAKGISALDLWRIRGPDAQKKLGLLFEGKISDDVSPEFTHQKSFHIPTNPITRRQCPPAWLLHDLASEAALSRSITTDPLIYHFQNRTYIEQGNNEFDVGTEFCSVIFAPQPESEEYGKYAFHNSAIEGWGPDSIHCEINSTDIRMIPEHPDYFGALTIGVDRARKGSAPDMRQLVLAVYTIPYVLNHPGVYQFTGEVEFQSYDWVMEDPIDVSTEQHDYYMIENPLQTRSPPITIVGAPIDRPHQKCHFDGFNDLRGRWYRAEAFTREGSQTALNPLAHLEFAEHNNTVDEWGWTFAPDACSLTYFTPTDHEMCLAHRTLQVLGDSNSRRLMKSIIGGGRGWCTDTEDRFCQCEDTWEVPLQDMNYKDVDSAPLRDVFLREQPVPFGSNTTLWFDFVGGLLNSKLFNAWTLFFDRPIDPNAAPLPSSSPDITGTETPEASTELTNLSQFSSSIIDKRLRNGTIDVVHISFLGWDIAALRTPSQVLSSLPTFRNTLLRTYPPGTRFITRLANNMCCGNQNQRTRYSSPRFRMWNAMWRNFWARDESSDRIRIDDASVLQGRRDAETKFYCPTTHLRSAHVRIEQMMWMGSVCEKSVSIGSRAMGDDALTGEIKFRNWGWTKEDVMMAGPGINELKNGKKVD